MSYEHTCGPTTECARGGSLWNRDFVKGACSRLSCSTSSLNGGSKCGQHAFQGGQSHNKCFGAYEEENGGRGAGGGGTAGKPALETSLWGMLYADDAGVVPHSPKQLRKMMGVIVVVCAAFGLTVSETKIEIMCLRTKGMPEATAIFSVEAAGQVYNQTNEFVYLGGNVNHNANLSTEVNLHIHNAWCSSRKYTLELYDRPSAPLEVKIRMLRAEVLETTLYGCVTWSPRVCHHDMLSPPQLSDSLHRLAKERLCRPPDFVSQHAY